MSSPRSCGESIDSASAASSHARPRVASTAVAKSRIPASGPSTREAGAASPSVEPSGAQSAASGATMAVTAAEYRVTLTKPTLMPTQPSPNRNMKPSSRQVIRSRIRERQPANRPGGTSRGAGRGIGRPSTSAARLRSRFAPAFHSSSVTARIGIPIVMKESPMPSASPRPRISSHAMPSGSATPT